MGSIISSHQQPTTSEAGLNTSSNFKSRKSKRLIDKLRRKSADNQIDPVFIEFAQNPNEDPQLSDDSSKQTLDLDEIVIQLRDGEQTSHQQHQTGFSDGATHSQAESTKQNADSFNSTAAAEASPREVVPQPSECIADQLYSSVPEDNQTCSVDNNPSAISEGADKPSEAQGI